MVWHIYDPKLQISGYDETYSQIVIIETIK